MTEKEAERLAVVETKMDGLDERMRCIEKKLDLAITNKADKTDLEGVKGTLNKVILGVAGTAVITLLGLFIYLLQGHLHL